MAILLPVSTIQIELRISLSPSLSLSVLQKSLDLRRLFQTCLKLANTNLTDHLAIFPKKWQSEAPTFSRLQIRPDPEPTRPMSQRTAFWTSPHRRSITIPTYRRKDRKIRLLRSTMVISSHLVATLTTALFLEASISFQLMMCLRQVTTIPKPLTLKQNLEAHVPAFMRIPWCLLRKTMKPFRCTHAAKGVKWSEEFDMWSGYVWS